MTVTKKERAQKTIECLKELYPEVACSLNYNTPLQMLLATQMSAQCTDASVNRVTEKLFLKYKDVYDFANADLEELQGDIRSIGLYKNKSKNIIACSKRIIEEFGGEVPDNMDDLLSLAGTGRKTANLILGEIFGRPTVVVDTHCIRLTNRIGLVNVEKPELIEKELIKIIAPEERLALCHRFVYHGRQLCMARGPKCAECSLVSFCKYGKKFKQL